MKRPGEMACGFASHLHDDLPNASFIGFTDTLTVMFNRMVP
jgi:hypothetical protein